MIWQPLLVMVLAALILWKQDKLPSPLQTIVAPIAVAAIGTGIWSLSVIWTGTFTFPSPSQTGAGLLELIDSNRLWGDIIASLFRVSWGFFLAAGIGIPLGLFAGWSLRAYTALNPIIQGLRPISPIAWIPIAILWFGIGDGAGIYLIFLSAFFPIAVGTMAAVRNISLVHQRSAANFGLHGLELFRRVVLPAAMPQIITSLRIALGVAWLVIVAAEMVGMDSGLGYLINDARNAGSRYDLVVATMLVIGLIGIVLDVLIRQLERFDEVKWGYVKR
ncbi:MAG: NitT/TauT family transport system permease protein [Candidatus Paceibacteria bacterium]|jgi:NitT/TauT family transport system permease protein